MVEKCGVFEYFGEGVWVESTKKP